MNFTIRPIEPPDYDAVWQIFHSIVSQGETYAYAPDSSPQDAIHHWIEVPLATYVAEQDGTILGTYYLKPNQPGLGDHVANCGYMVAAAARGQGVATALCKHSQSEALRLGFWAIQFNFVVSTNERAITLWQRLGFTIVGTIPKGFRHASKGLVDVYIMYKQLEQ
ncbi:MAG: GNAT family N-acetyltransferase [Synechococcales cyanobacterium RM1_1_8]|nr:GNAT family N-acetyltransferase [Synechococcales cyanobacterium RM1_1_8]